MRSSPEILESLENESIEIIRETAASFFISIPLGNFAR